MRLNRISITIIALLFAALSGCGTRKSAVCNWQPGSESPACWPASPAEQYGVMDGDPMRCFEGFGATAIVWNARENGYCYDEDKPKGANKDFLPGVAHK